MDPNYRASEGQWTSVEDKAIRHRLAGSECLLELRSRIEALEAAQQLANHIAGASKMVAPPAPAGGLVERVAHLLAMRFSKSCPGTDCTPFACDVLREVAAWLRSEPWLGRAAADRLEQEANQ
jgi:hypothetical protein